jgi:alkanesulfonate monooxygenase SsuD/methylene tetrahydromethanopterin reductase-like flavin-dependent oxidoreductase (luciferase family)
MANIGLVVAEANAQLVVDRIKQAEEMGIPAVWMTIGGASGGDVLTTYAAAAVVTKRILMGTAIVPNMPRHPIIMAQQANAINSLAPGRFRLGIGPSHKAVIENTFGYAFDKPLSRLGEYVNIVSTLLSEGDVQFDGEFYNAHTKIANPAKTTIMASALRTASFEFCGARGIAALSWVCPANYLRHIAMPAIKRGAEKAGHTTTPPLIAHVPVCLSEDPEEVRAAVREQMGHYPKAPFYAQMFTDAGFPEASEGVWSDAMVDATVIWGNEEQIQAKMKEWLSYGFEELMAHPVIVGPERETALLATMEVIATAAQQQG